MGPRTGLDVLGKIKVVCDNVGHHRYRNGSVGVCYLLMT